MKTTKTTRTMKNYLVLLLTVFAIIVNGCSKEDDDTPKPSDTTPPPANEEELITSAILTFVDSAGVQPSVQYAFRDPDGEGGNGPTEHDTIRLVANTSYNATIQLLNESESPAEDITLEVQQEADEHLFCYTPSNTNVSIMRTDSDGAYEVGITTRWATGATSNGETVVSLKHQPGVKDGTCAPGDTDIEVTFVTEVQ